MVGFIGGSATEEMLANGFPLEDVERVASAMPPPPSSHTRIPTARGAMASTPRPRVVCETAPPPPHYAMHIERCRPDCVLCDGLGYCFGAESGPVGARVIVEIQCPECAGTGHK